MAEANELFGGPQEGLEGGQHPGGGVEHLGPGRSGGQHIVKVAGMPPFKGTLTDAEIKNVVTFERDGLK